MNAPAADSRFDLVRHNLALGLKFVDAATGAPLSAPLRAVIESAGPRRIGLAMMAKPDGAALRLERRIAGLFRPAAGQASLAVTILIAPERGLAGRLPPDRSTIPRRIRLDLDVGAEGLRPALAPDVGGRSVFEVRLCRGPTAPWTAGETAVRGCLMRGVAGDAAARPIRWAHVVARHGSDAGPILATARSDDRGEFILRLNRRAAQSPNRLREIALKLRFHVPPQAVPPQRLASYDDVPSDPLGQPDDTIDLPPALYVAHPGPLTAISPGQLDILPTVYLP